MAFFCNDINTPAPDDIGHIRELLDRPQELSEPFREIDYKRYLVLTEDFDTELGVEISTYPLPSKRSAEREISGYFQRPNHPWSKIDNHLTAGISSAQPDLVESYRTNNYPPTAVDVLEGFTPSLYNEAMPAYAVEFKSSTGDMGNAKEQCAYDGALMTQGAYAIHSYMGKSDYDFYSKTQAFTIVFNGKTVKFYAHHVVELPPKSLQQDDNVEATIEYHQYLLTSDHPRNSLESFQAACIHLRNAQDIGYKWATERKDALWAMQSTEKRKLYDSSVMS